MLLAVDTSTRRPGIALYDGFQVVNELSWISQFHHTVELAPAVEWAFRRAGIQVEQLECLAVALGPGSFTSLRTGLAFAKGMALAENLPVVGVPSLDVLAASQPVISRTPMIAVLEAGRTRLAVGYYKAKENRWRATKELALMTAQELSEQIRRPTLICGELDERARNLLKRKWKNARLASPAQSHRRPSYLAELGWERWKAGRIDDPASLAPIYLSEHMAE